MTEVLSGFATSLAALAADPITVSKAAVHHHLIDALALAGAGLGTADGKALATSWGGLPLTDPIARAAVMAGAIRLTEADDIHLPSCVTPSAIAVPIALTFARQADLAGAALVAGWETGIRLGQALGGAQALAVGVWPTLAVGSTIAAVTAGVGLRLDKAGLERALVLALSGGFARAGRAHGSPAARWWMIAAAVEQGARAAQAAQAGFAGDGDAALARFAGLVDRFDPAPLAPFATALAAGSISLKPFVTSRQALPAIVALQRLLSAGLDRGNIGAITVALPSRFVAVAGRAADAPDRLSRLASAAFGLAAVIEEPARLFDVSRDEVPRALLERAASVRVVADAALDSYPPDRWPARVDVATSHGIRSELAVECPGDPSLPLDKAALIAKHRALSGDRVAGLVAHDLANASASPRLWDEFEIQLRSG